MSEHEDRIDRDDKGNLDDVVICDVEAFHMEWMDDKTVWICLSRKGKPDQVFWLRSRGKIAGVYEQDS